MLLEWLFISYLYERDHLQQVLMTYGLILVFEELRSILVDNDVHGVPVPPWLAGSIAAGRPDAVPGVSARDLGRMPRRGRAAVLRHRAHAARHDDPRGQLEPRDGRSRSASTSSSSIASCSRPASRWRCWRG